MGDDMTEKRDAIADAIVAENPAYKMQEWMDYDEWLLNTGLDDSFVGDGDGKPGSADIYNAAERELAEWTKTTEVDDSPSPD